MDKEDILPLGHRAQGTDVPPFASNPFRALWGLGYKRLVPIVPPGAPISPRSTLANRAHLLGKIPGVRGPNGKWHSFDWLQRDPDETDLDRYAAMGAGVGIKTGPQGDGTWLVAIDADTTHEGHAATIRNSVHRAFGIPPTRIGRAPKALYVVRLSGELRYSRIDFDDGSGKPARVEVLSAGKQFVAQGVHPETKRAYAWPVSLRPYADLLIHSPDEIL